jgi:cytochrome c oxidase subunit 2
MPQNVQSVFAAHSSEAQSLLALTWVLFVGAAIVFVVVMALVYVAMRRRPAWLADERVIVVGGIVFPVIVLTVLLVYALKLVAAPRDTTPGLRIEVTGFQWWWRVRYLTADGALDFETANEIRLPVGQRAEVLLASHDVIHSFWVPSLNGKLDMIPGRVTRTTLSAGTEGVFRGQCAEYCGGPHALMALHVVALAPEAFEQWRALQRQPATASEPAFVQHCAVCHTVRGTDARGALGPDLTHVAGRVALGAGVLPNAASTLAEWIAESQRLKPGNLMPSFGHLERAELARIAGYVGSLE